MGSRRAATGIAAGLIDGRQGDDLTYFYGSFGGRSSGDEIHLLM
jgi:hypothetical protein